MQTSARTFGYTFAASLGLHGLLLLTAAALMTVMPVLPREGRTGLPALSAVETVPDPEELVPPDPQEVEITFLSMAQIPEEKKLPEIPPEPLLARPAGDKMIYAREDQPALAPLNPDTPFISSQNMRAASTSAPTPGADPNLPNQDGEVLPVLSLISSAFAEGGEPHSASPPPPPVPDAAPRTGPAADPPPAPEPSRSSEERPPEPQSTVQTTDPLAPAPPDKPAEQAASVPEPPPALRERPLGPVAETRLKAEPPLRPRDPVVTRRDQAKQGQRASLSSLKTKSVGAVTQQGEASVDARDTPEGRYIQAIHDVINPIYNRRRSAVPGLTGAGVVEVAFEIDVRGTVSNVRLVDPGKANPVFEDVCVASVVHAKFPPPPTELREEMRHPLANGKLHRRYSFYKLFH